MPALLRQLLLYGLGWPGLLWFRCAGRAVCMPHFAAWTAGEQRECCNVMMNMVCGFLCLAGMVVVEAARCAWECAEANGQLCLHQQLSWSQSALYTAAGVGVGLCAGLCADSRQSGLCADSRQSWGDGPAAGCRVAQANCSHRQHS